MFLKKFITAFLFFADGGSYVFLTKSGKAVKTVRQN